MLWDGSSEVTDFPFFSRTRHPHSSTRCSVGAASLQSEVTHSQSLHGDNDDDNDDDDDDDDVYDADRVSERTQRLQSLEYGLRVFWVDAEVSEEALAFLKDFRRGAF